MLKLEELTERQMDLFTRVFHYVANHNSNLQDWKLHTANFIENKFVFIDEECPLYVYVEVLDDNRISTVAKNFAHKPLPKCNTKLPFHCRFKGLKDSFLISSDIKELFYHLGLTCVETDDSSIIFEDICRVRPLTHIDVVNGFKRSSYNANIVPFEAFSVLDNNLFLCLKDIYNVLNSVANNFEKNSWIAFNIVNSETSDLKIARDVSFVSDVGYNGFSALGNAISDNRLDVNLLDSVNPNLCKILEEFTFSEEFNDDSSLDRFFDLSYEFGSVITSEIEKHFKSEDDVIEFENHYFSVIDEEFSTEFKEIGRKLILSEKEINISYHAKKILTDYFGQDI